MQRRQFLASALLAPAAAHPRVLPGAWRLVQEPGAAPEEGAASRDEPAPSARVARFESLAYGLFLHWGLYSLRGVGEWTMHLHQVPRDEYLALRARFDAADFDARAIARTARRAGMRYATLTTRHHDGFSLYDTRGLSELDVAHSAAGRDLVREFVEGCRAEGIVPFLYHTTLDWSDPRFASDWDGYLDYLHASLELLATDYGPLGGFWLDGDWSRTDVDWRLDERYALLRRLQPEAMLITNTGLGAGGVLTHPELDGVTFERGRPDPLDRRGHPKYVVGEMCQTLNLHWGCARQDFEYKSPAVLIRELSACRRAGANYLLNVGPTAGGALPAYEAATLERAGEWVALHPEAIHAARPGGIVGPDRDFGLAAAGRRYLFVHAITPWGGKEWVPEETSDGPRTFTGVPGEVHEVRWSDDGSPVHFEHDAAAGRLTLEVPPYAYGRNLVVRVAVVS